MGIFKGKSLLGEPATVEIEEAAALFSEGDRNGRSAQKLAALIIAAEKEVEHFDAIAAKSEHWRAVVQASEIAEGRWSGIRNHARHRASVLRAAIAEARG